MNNNRSRPLLGGVSYGTLAIILALITILSRWPFQATLLDSYDAVSYALGLDHFDMGLSQPQPPGYPLYILAGRVFNLVFHDHLAALVWLSSVASGLAVLAIFLVGKEIFGPRAGLFAALFLATSTVFWYLGEVAAPYAPDLLASTTVGLLCYRLTRSSSRRAIWLCALAVGLAGALRLQTLVFLAPLFLFSLRQRPWKEILSTLAVAGAVFALFFVPAVVASGGLWVFADSMQNTVPIFRSPENLVRSAQWLRFVKNTLRIIAYTVLALGELTAILAVVGLFSRPERQRFWRNPRLLFLLVWFLPTWLVYILIWPGNIGTIMVCIPPFFVLAAQGLEWLIERPRWGKVLGGVALVGILLWNTVVFTVLPSRPFGDSYRHFDNHARLEETIDGYQAELALVSQVPVEGTIVYAYLFRHLQYYLPEYRIFYPPLIADTGALATIMSIEDGDLEYWIDVEVESLIPPGTERVIFFDLPTEAIQADESLVETLQKDGHIIYVLTIPDNHIALWTRNGLSIRAHE